MSAAQIQIILSSLDSFAGLIGQVLGADNASRRGAEDLYAQLKKARPDACATSLLQLMRTSDRSDVRSTCAVFLRKVCGRQLTGFHSRRGPSKQTAQCALHASRKNLNVALEMDTLLSLVLVNCLCPGPQFFKPGPKEAGWKHLSKATQVGLGLTLRFTVHVLPHNAMTTPQTRRLT